VRVAEVENATVENVGPLASAFSIRVNTVLLITFSVLMLTVCVVYCLFFSGDFILFITCICFYAPVYLVYHVFEQLSIQLQGLRRWKPLKRQTRATHDCMATGRSP